MGPEAANDSREMAATHEVSEEDAVLVPSWREGFHTIDGILGCHHMWWSVGLNAKLSVWKHGNQHERSIGDLE